MECEGNPGETRNRDRLAANSVIPEYFTYKSLFPKDLAGVAAKVY
jgi:hypothetical protein